jgi:subtilisin-like proprotein convertase family protein
LVLHDRQGGSSNDIARAYDLDSNPGLSVFVGDRIQGDWTLSVSDHAWVDTGKLMFWELELSIQKVEKKELTKEAIPNQQIPDNDPDGIESRIEISKSGKIIRLDIPVDISHTWIGDLRVLLVSPSGTEVVLHDRSGYSRHDIKKIYSTTTDEPMLAILGSEIQGIWKLKVVDTYSRDIGTLNSWGIHCVYE